MSERMTSFKVRYLIKHVDKYVISGFPGVGIGYLTHDSTHEGLIRALETYTQRAKQKETVVLSNNANARELYQRTKDILVSEPLQLAKKLDGRLYVGSPNELIYVEDQSITIGRLMSQMFYLGPYYSFIMLKNVAGEISSLRNNGLKYSIHSNELNKHSEPHVHVSYSGQNASIQIGNGKVLAGELPKKQQKEAVDTVIREARLLLERWNKESNGIRIVPEVYLRKVSIEVDEGWLEKWDINTGDSD